MEGRLLIVRLLLAAHVDDLLRSLVDSRVVRRFCQLLQFKLMRQLLQLPDLDFLIADLVDEELIDAAHVWANVLVQKLLLHLLSFLHFLFFLLVLNRRLDVFALFTHFDVLIVEPVDDPGHLIFRLHRRLVLFEPQFVCFLALSTVADQLIELFIIQFLVLRHFFHALVEIDVVAFGRSVQILILVLLQISLSLRNRLLEGTSAPPRALLLSFVEARDDFLDILKVDLVVCVRFAVDDCHHIF